MSVADIYDGVYVPDIFALVLVDLNVRGYSSDVFQCVVSPSVFVTSSSPKPLYTF